MILLIEAFRESRSDCHVRHYHQALQCHFEAQGDRRGKCRPGFSDACAGESTKCRTYPAHVASDQGLDKCGTQVMPLPASCGPWQNSNMLCCLKIMFGPARTAVDYSDWVHATCRVSKKILCDFGKHEILGQKLQLHSRLGRWPCRCTRSSTPCSSSTPTSCPRQRNSRTRLCYS